MRKIPDRFRRRRRPDRRRLGHRPAPSPRRAAAPPRARRRRSGAAARPGQHPLSRPSPSPTACASSSTTDRKAPIVAVSVWYNVGSKDEPAGRTGFAHLFEHLMFNGSENAPGDYFTYTARDRRDRFERHHLVRPHQLFRDRAARRRSSSALFLESDRMGHLLGAITQEELDNQRGVVQNEKRQGDNEPYGMVEYAQLEDAVPRRAIPIITRRSARWPISTPPRSTTVRDWFREQLRPEQRRARPRRRHQRAPRRGRWSSAISATSRAGRSTIPAAADVPTLPHRVDRVMHDRVANTRLYRNWVVPGLTAEDHGAAQRRRRPSSAACPARGSTMPWSAASRARSRVTAERPAVPPDQPCSRSPST